jgi:hypothetical protein
MTRDSGRLHPRRPDYPAILEAHRVAVDAGEPGYADPSTGLFVLTATYLRQRGYCCENGCRHCPYGGRVDPNAAGQPVAPGGST